jgi:hypothetical protein
MVWGALDWEFQVLAGKDRPAFEARGDPLPTRAERFVGQVAYRLLLPNVFGMLGRPARFMRVRVVF